MRQVPAYVEAVWTALDDREVPRTTFPDCTCQSTAAALRLRQITLTVAGGHLAGCCFRGLDRA